MRSAQIIDFAARRAKSIEAQMAADLAVAEAELVVADLRYHARRALIFSTLRGSLARAQQEWDEVSGLLQLATADLRGKAH